MTDPTADPLLRAVLSAGIPARSRLVVAVSGGPDSVALLDALQRARVGAATGWELMVAHINHGLRPGDAEADAEFVCRLAEDMKLPVEVLTVDTERIASERHMSLETTARELRYDGLHRIMDAWRGDLMLVGHTADDQAETLLMHLMRGSGLDGLAGMRIRRERIVRPFLSLSRETILTAAQRQGLPFRLDASNADPRFTRNRIRYEVMPSLRQFARDASARLATAASLASLDVDLLHQEAQAAEDCLRFADSAGTPWLSLSAWRTLHPALRGRVLRAALRSLHGHVTEIDALTVARLASTLLRAGDRYEGVLDVKGDIVLDIRGGFFRVVSTRPELSPPLSTHTLDVPGEANTESGRLSVASLERDAAGIPRALTVCGPLHALCDADVVGNRLTVRARRPGDRVHPLGMTGSRKLQDVLVDRRAPRRLRDRIPVIENETQIVWIPGYVLDNRVVIRDGTQRIAHLTWVPNPAE